MQMSNTATVPLLQGTDKSKEIKNKKQVKRQERIKGKDGKVNAGEA
jgi:hypothetical protein